MVGCLSRLYAATDGAGQDNRFAEKMYYFLQAAVSRARILSMKDLPLEMDRQKPEKHYVKSIV
jgi:hypothetical protein